MALVQDRVDLALVGVPANNIDLVKGLIESLNVSLKLGIKSLEELNAKPVKRDREARLKSYLANGFGFDDVLRADVLDEARAKHYE